MKRGKGEVSPSERCCDCMKKANKECAYKRCRSCCVAAMRRLGYHCVPHMKDTDRRPAKNHDDKKNANSAFLASVTKSLKVGKGHSALQTVYPQVPWQTVTHPMVALEAYHTNLMAECPYCHGQISQLGAQPWLHLRECLCGHWASQFDKMSLPAFKDKAEPAGDKPVGLAAEKAAERLELITDVTEHVFDDVEPPGIALKRIRKTVASDDIKREAESFVEQLKDVEDRCSSFAVPKKVSASSQRFYDSMDMVDACTSLSELQHVHEVLVQRGSLLSGTYDPAASTTPFLLASASQQDMFDNEDDDYEEPAPLPRFAITYL